MEVSLVFGRISVWPLPRPGTIEINKKKKHVLVMVLEQFIKNFVLVE